ncbi:MAG: FecR domain-containing protein, partial [Planctomycetes bacterium]|nr:FecR domain-containing protein [Planctomycetota bacterium]
ASPDELAELDAALGHTDEVAAWAAESNELHRLLEQALRSPRRRQEGVEGVMRAVRVLPGSAAAPRVMGTVRALDRQRSRLLRRRIIARIVVWSAAAAAIVIAASLWMVGRDARGESALFASGDGAHRMRGGVEAPLVAGTAIFPGDRIACGPGSATVTFADGTSLDLQAGTLLDLQAGTGKRLHLADGRLSATVAPQRRPFVISTPQSVTAVIGTRFILDTDGERTRLSVSEGSVRMQRADAKGSASAAVDVGAGHAAEARADLPLVARTIEPLYAFDFEDGALPPMFAAGTPGSPPVSDGGRTCLVGTPEPQWSPDRNIVCIRRNAYVQYQEGLRCGFDFLVTEPVTEVGVMIYDADQDQNYGTGSTAPEPRRWHHLEFAFAQLVPYLRPAEHMAAGDRIDSLYIVPHGAAAQRFYVDNLVIWREVPEKP